MSGLDHHCAHDRAAALWHGGRTGSQGDPPTLSSAQGRLCLGTLTPAAYRALLDAQGGGCAICCRDQGPQPGHGVGGLRVDHDHATGAVRGLLCAACTIGLAYLHDDPDLLRAAIAYLEDS